MFKNIISIATASALMLGCTSLDVNNEARRTLLSSINKVKIPDFHCGFETLISRGSSRGILSQIKAEHVTQESLDYCLKSIYNEIKWRPNYLIYKSSGVDPDLSSEQMEFLALKNNFNDNFLRISQILKEVELIYAATKGLDVEQVRSAKDKIDERMSEIRPISEKLNESVRNFSGSYLFENVNQSEVNSVSGVRYLSRNNRKDILAVKVEISRSLKVYFSGISPEESKYWEHLEVGYKSVSDEYENLFSEMNSKLREFSKVSFKRQIKDDLISLESSIEEQNKLKSQLDERNQILHNEKEARKLGLKGYYNDFELDLESGRMPVGSVGRMVQITDDNQYEAIQSFGRKGLFEMRSGRIPLIVTFPKAGYVAEGQALESTFYKVISISPYKTISGALRNAVFLEYIGD